MNTGKAGPVFIRGKLWLESKSDCQLHLSRIADTLSQEPVEVEESRRDERVDIVRVVEGIEHLDDRNYREAFVEFKWPLNAPVEREVLVVFAQRVAIGGSAHGRRDRLGGSGLHAEISLESPTHLDEGEKIKLVTDVAIGIGVVELQVVDIKRAIGKRIAFV